MEISDEVKKMLKELENAVIDDPEFIDLIWYRPWADYTKKYKLGFDPKTIAALVESRAKRHGRGPEDMDFLIRLAVELGDDLDEVARTAEPDRANEFRRLRVVYGLVSGPPSRGAETAVTLSRLCAAYPTRACSYLHERRQSPETTAALGPDYPPAMMTSAFAFLVPNRGDAYCVRLMKAHMLHEYEVQKPFVSKRHTSGPHDRVHKIIAHVVRRTLTAVAASCVPYDEQLGFLTRVGLVRAIGGRSRSEDAEEGTADTEEIVVTEHVAAAARAWDERDSKYYTTHLVQHLGSPLKLEVECQPDTNNI